MLRANGELDSSTVVIDSTQVRAFGGGENMGLSPVDRRKKGSKYTLLTDRNGVPLVIQTTSANTSDHRQILSTVVQFPQIGGKRGRPIEPHIRDKNDPHGSHLGRIRWVVERTISWVKGLRRMRIRYDRSGIIVDAFATLAAAMGCFHILQEV